MVSTGLARSAILPPMASSCVETTYYGGKYSIHRLLALEEYTRNTSVLRAVLVCLGTPLPTISVVLIQESIPLQDPAKGWRGNYGFWIRSTILAIVVARIFAVQAQYFIQGMSISWFRNVLLCVCTSTIFNVLAAVVSAHTIFPIPFFALTTAPIFFLAFIVTSIVIVGTRAFRQLVTSREQLIQYICFLGAQIVMAFTYPAYEGLYRLAQGTQHQLPAIVLFPVIKIAMKNMVLRCTLHMEDMAPEAVIFTVEFFNAIYVSTCMQSTSSLLVVAMLIITDLSQTAFMLYGLHKRTANALRRLHQNMGIATKPPKYHTLLSAACALCLNPDKFAQQYHEDIRVYSCLPHVLSMESKQQLDKLEKFVRPSDHTSRDIPGLINLEPQLVKKAYKCGSLGFPCFENCVEDIRSVVPMVVEVRKRTVKPFSGSRGTPTWSRSFTDRSTILRESLEILFSIECLVLTAYLEAGIPIYYCCYVLMMATYPALTITLRWLV